MHRRKFIGGELKASYFQTAIQNLTRAEQDQAQETLFDLSAL